MSNNVFQKTLLAKTISSIVSVPALPVLALAATLSATQTLAAVVNLPASAGTDGGATTGTSGTAAVTPVVTDSDTYNLTGGNNLVGGSGGSGITSASGVAGNGGNGAAGIEVDGSSNTFNFSGDVTGGSGGTGGQGLNGSSTGGFAGSGANAIQLDGSSNTFDITGTITGGAGGRGGFGGTQRNGANGAVAIGVNGSNNVITVDGGTVIGGAGGDRPSGTTWGGVGAVAAQINGNSNRLITNGTLSGGDPGVGNTAVANAVQISGSGNTLELQDGYSFSGDDVIVQSGSHTLALGGTTDASFDTTFLVGSQPAADATTQFVNFSGLEKTGVSNWTLTGTRGDNGTTTITQGTLTADAAALGNGNISNATSLTVNQGADGTYAGIISGVGSVTKTGASTLTVTGNSTYTGGTTISAGTLAIGNGGTSGTITGNIVNNSALQFNRSDAVAYSDVISGTGSIIKTGAGALTLTGTNTYAGGTTISSGTLAIGNGSTTGSITGNIVNNSALQFNRSDDVTFSDAISGTGSVTKAGAGALTLTGTNTYAGGTTINSGTLAIGNGGTMGSITGNIVNNSALQFNRSDAVTFSDEISGTGSVAIESRMTLTGNNTYLGGTVISAGFLEVGDGGTIGSITGNIANNAELVFNRSDAVTFSNDISGTGTVLKVNNDVLILTGTNTYSGGTKLYGGTLQIGDGGTTGSITGDIENHGALEFNRSDDVTFSDVISSNGSLEQKGAGILTLTGTNTYTGTTTVSSGTLALTDGASIGGSEVTVNNGTVLQSSSATIGVLNNEGTVEIVADKTLSISGNYTQASNGTFRTNISNDNSYGKLVVGGTATLPSNAKIDVNVADENFSFSTSSMVDIISAGTLNSDGSFEVEDNSVVFDFTASKDGNTVDLGLSAVVVDEPIAEKAPVYAIEGSVIASSNNVAVGAARSLDTLAVDFANSGSTGNAGMDDVIGIIGGFTTEQQVSNAVSQTLPLLQGSSQQVTLNAMRDVQAIVETRLGGGTGLASGDELGKGSNFWIKAFGSNIDLEDDGSISGLNADIYGIVLGADSQLNDKTNLGLAFSYADANIDGNSEVAPQNAEVDSFQLTTYGDYQLGATTELTAQAAYGINHNDGERHISFTSTTAKSDYDSQSYHLGIGVSHSVWVNEKVELVPFTHLAYNRIDDDSYTETGAGALNLHVNSRSSEELVVRLGGKFNYLFNTNTKFISGLSVGYDAINDDNSIVSSFAGSAGSSFYTAGMDLAPWIYNAAVGLQYETDGGTEITARYDAQDRDNAFSQTASLKVKWMF